MDDGGNPQSLGREDNRDRDEAAFGEDQIGVDPVQKFSGLKKALQHMEGIGKILGVKVAPQFS